MNASMQIMLHRHLHILFWVLLAGGMLQPAQAQIDKVYHPYVEAGETETELRSIYESDGDEARDGRLLSRLGFGRAVTERVFLEAYLIGEDTPGDRFELEAYEMEARVQLTEQGEYWADWGALFELERERDSGEWEAASGLLIEKESGRWSTAVNLGLEYESESGEFEAGLAGQLRYRQSPRFEPAVELYAGEDTLGLGPVIIGAERLGARNAISWELGIIAGLDDDTADRTLRFLVEFEF